MSPETHLLASWIIAAKTIWQIHCEGFTEDSVSVHSSEAIKASRTFAKRKLAGKNGAFGSNIFSSPWRGFIGLSQSRAARINPARKSDQDLNLGFVAKRSVGIDEEKRLMLFQASGLGIGELTPWQPDPRRHYVGSMSSRLYDTFCELLETLPVKAIIRAADAERRMVTDDLEKKRTPADEESISVLEFCNYLIDTAHGLHSSLPIWPTEHCEFYRQVVRRLVEAGELPAKAGEPFHDHAVLRLQERSARCSR